MTGFRKRASARTALLCLLTSVGTATAIAPASAGMLQVDPIKVEINTDRKTGSVTVTNVEQAPVAIRAYALAWSQPEGDDRYEDTAGIIVSPPIFSIPAGGTQTVRVGLRNAAAAGHSYRLIIEEVPQANTSGGIKVALRLNLPLFAMVEAGSEGELSWAAWQQPDRSWVLEATNKGSHYVRVDPAKAAADTGVAASSAVHYGVVLPGSSRRWLIGDKPAIQDKLRFQHIVRADSGDGKQQIALSSR
jgi:fimbrial chaperone protein